MTKYRIKVEALDPAEELRAEYRIGIECEGFLIVADKGDGHNTSIHKLSPVEMASMIANDPDLINVACIALGMVKGNKLAEEKKREVAVSSFAKRLAGMMGED